jgi:RNA polymerase sigma-70 factor (ECF subfamily)
MALPLATLLFEASSFDDASRRVLARPSRAEHDAHVQENRAVHDAQLVAQIQQGNVDAFSTVYRQYYSAIWAFAFRYTGRHDDASDIAQDVFRLFWERRTTLVVQGTLRGLLFTAARNRALNAARNAQTATRLAHSEMMMTGTPPGMAHDHHESAPAQAETNDLHAAVMRVVDTFPPRRREVFLMKWQDELSYGEIAMLLDVSRKAVELHMTNAYRALRTELRHVFE